ncbi:hypothetical protein [Allochromatium vinosum]|uniref:DNA-binding protein n=1 Tax=Allochromatium vinosum (strain ATCC 17899 / DSM 180 / NBRC 103801 / NCIMB 10441 / D) TaxID=572477 RepID=D3RR11_ALLVD|nr:hypothetical protein [Allochromatium vinosum]ADC61839.1 conserved hypothetical protein [Allochromatium vinosum DSM 180]
MPAIAHRDTTASANSSTAPSQWRSIGALAERLNAGAKRPTFTEYSLRHYIRNAHRNGLAPAVKRLGRKILVNEDAFIAWLNSREAA